jgi:hypothetical protein
MNDYHDDAYRQNDRQWEIKKWDDQAWNELHKAPALKTGNIGVITNLDNDKLFEITGIRNGLIYCISLVSPSIVRVCLPDHFWVLLDEF